MFTTTEEDLESAVWSLIYSGITTNDKELKDQILEMLSRNVDKLIEQSDETTLEGNSVTSTVNPNDFRILINFLDAEIKGRIRKEFQVQKPK